MPVTRTSSMEARRDLRLSYRSLQSSLHLLADGRDRAATALKQRVRRLPSLVEMHPRRTSSWQASAIESCSDIPGGS